MQYTNILYYTHICILCVWWIVIQILGYDNCGDDISHGVFAYITIFIECVEKHVPSIIPSK